MFIFSVYIQILSLSLLIRIKRDLMRQKTWPTLCTHTIVLRNIYKIFTTHLKLLQSKAITIIIIIEL